MPENYKFYIAGVQFYEAKNVLHDLKVGNRLRLEEEPTNQYDPNAVQIIHVTDETETMLGYVPKKFSASVSAFLELSNAPVCSITAVDPKAKTWEQIEVEIREEENSDA